MLQGGLFLVERKTQVTPEVKCTTSVFSLLPPHVACLAASLLYLTRTPKINDLPVKMPIDQIRPPC